jgi:hypothetical protein
VACQLLFWPWSTTTLQNMNETGRFQLTSAPCVTKVYQLIHDTVGQNKYMDMMKPQDMKGNTESHVIYKYNAGCPLISNTIHCLRVSGMMLYSWNHCKSTEKLISGRLFYFEYKLWAIYGMTNSQVVSFMLWPLYPTSKRPTFYMNSNLHGPEGQSRCHKQKKILWPAGD